MLTDSFGRRVDYLRLSVTDRCGLRCAYCLPAQGASFTPAAELLTDGEIETLTGVFARLGVSAVRVTGGEPLSRPGIAGLIERLARVPGIEDLSLSTNGMGLRRLARDLARAGLKRVNVSVDSLDPERFRTITGFGVLSEALAGVDAALDAGLTPVKINMVVARGLNEDEIGRFAALTRERPLHVRFIELMPMGETGFFSPERRVPLDEMMARAGQLEPAPERPAGRGPARCWRLPGARGTVGFISALSCGFCATCNRMRLTAGGTLLPCLDGEDGTDLKALLRAGAGPEELSREVAEAVRRKPREHAMRDRASSTRPNPRLMCGVGG